MKIVGCVALHYGREYIQWAIRSVIDYVDELVVLYSPEGSHGTRTNVVCPESRPELYVLSLTAAGADKLTWMDGKWSFEGQQRDTIFQVAPDADAIITLDADEIWPEDLIKAAVDYIRQASVEGYKHRGIRVPMIHFWRSFHRAIMHDPAYPVRIVFPKASPLLGEETMFQHLRPICHMGYSQSAQIIGYKMQIHGHIGQFRHDCDWYQDKFLANAQHDCHPIGSEYWNPEPVNPLDWMPAFMREHPYFNLEVIP